ncbi:hypothetical protein [Catenulispora subtropica]|uniref:Uncharacterized protein n=1 Tax=Catenulispora subtropica TaxID=450798 RepID=A0ABP5CTS6_9ACTN
MDSLIARAVEMVATVGNDGGPNAPSVPVDIGTPGARHGHAEIGSWRMLIVMIISTIVIGTAVLMYVVRQRHRLLERRRLRRMAEAATSAGMAPRPETPPETQASSTSAARISARAGPQQPPEPAPKS